MSESESSPTSHLEGWHHRSKPHPSPHSFTPSKSALRLVLLLNAPAIHDGFTVALFEPDIAVDATGSVRVLSKEDFKGLIDLAHKVGEEIPETGTFRNTWPLDHEKTSQPIDRLLLPISHINTNDSPYTSSAEAGWELKNVASLQGYKEGLRKLREKVAGLEEVPEDLAVVVGLLREGREGWKKGEEDGEVLKKVRQVLGSTL